MRTNLISVCQTGDRGAVLGPFDLAANVWPPLTPQTYTLSRRALRSFSEESSSFSCLWTKESARAEEFIFFADGQVPEEVHADCANEISIGSFHPEHRAMPGKLGLVRTVKQVLRGRRVPADRVHLP